MRRQLAQQNAEVQSAMAQIEQARAQLTEAEANRADLVVRAPFSGTIVTRTAEPGEIAMAGTPIVTLVDLTSVYLRGYVPEGRIGAVKAGQPGRVYLDSDPTKPVAPAEIIQSAVDSAIPLLGPETVDIHRDIPESLPPVTGDAAALRSAVQNLVATPLKYGGRDRRWEFAPNTCRSIDVSRCVSERERPWRRHPGQRAAAHLLIRSIAAATRWRSRFMGTGSVCRWSSGS